MTTATAQITITHIGTEIKPLGTGLMAESVELCRIYPRESKTVSVYDLHKHITDCGHISYEEEGEYVPCEIGKVFWHGKDYGSFASACWYCCPGTDLSHTVYITQNGRRVIAIKRWVRGTYTTHNGNELRVNHCP